MLNETKRPYRQSRSPVAFPLLAERRQIVERLRPERQANQIRRLLYLVRAVRQLRPTTELRPQRPLASRPVSGGSRGISRPSASDGLERLLYCLVNRCSRPKAAGRIVQYSMASFRITAVVCSKTLPATLRSLPPSTTRLKQVRNVQANGRGQKSARE